MHFQKKLTVCNSRIQKCFLNLISTPKENSHKGPKNSIEGPKKVLERPKMWPNKNKKDRAVIPKPKLIVYIGRPQLQNSFKRVQKVSKRPQL